MQLDLRARTTVLVWLLASAVGAAMADARSLSRSGADILRQTAEIGLGAPRPLDMKRFDGADVSGLRRPLAIDEESLLRFLQRADPDLSRAVEAADPALRRVVLESLAGAQAIERALPSNPVRRAEIVERGGVDLLRAASRSEDGLGTALILLDGSIRSGRLQEDALAQFGRGMNSGGDSFARVWRDLIVPNWERVVAGGLVTAFLLNPEMFIDASGQLTSYAVAAFAELGVEIAMSVPGGLAEGINRAVRRRFENGEGWTVLVVVAAIITVPIGWLLFGRRLRQRRNSGKKA